YCSLTGQDLCDKFYRRDPMTEPSCDHWQFCEKVPNRSEVEADSLGDPVGLVCSTSVMDNPCGALPLQEEANSRNFAIYLKAFALVYILPEVDWTAEKIDMLLQEGTDLFEGSSEMDAEEQRGDPKLLQPEIYTQEEKRINRVFNLEGHTFTLALEPRYMGDISKPLEKQPPHILQNLRPVLRSFFKAGRYCLLLTRVGHLLIWRRRKSFFVLDVKGRRRDNLETVEKNGVAMLVCLKSIDNVVHLASNLSGITPKDSFTIRELVVVRLETPDGRIYMRDTSHRSIEFKVVNKNYAYLKGSLHLSLNKEALARNRSSLMVAVAAILASKIDHPANWNTNMLDRLICYGVQLCRSCWSDFLRDRRPIDLDTFPTQLRMGQFVLELKLIPNVRTGHWKCGVRIISTDFEAHVKQALKEYGNVVFQINDQMYAMWAKDEFFYLMDPYRHTIVGTHIAEDKVEGAKWATVRMFRDQLTMLSVFHQMLKESNRQSAYYLHVVRIRNLAECPKGFALAPLPDDVDAMDVESLNETILFNEQKAVRVGDKCLGEISDFEEDLISLTDDNFDVENFKLLTDRQIAGAEGELEENMEEQRRSRAKSRTRSAVRKQGVGNRISARVIAAKAAKASKANILRQQPNALVQGVQQKDATKKEVPKKETNKKEAPKKVVAFGGTALAKQNPAKSSRESGGRVLNLVPVKSSLRSSSRETPGRVTFKNMHKECHQKVLKSVQIANKRSSLSQVPKKCSNMKITNNKGTKPQEVSNKTSRPEDISKKAARPVEAPQKGSNQKPTKMIKLVTPKETPKDSPTKGSNSKISPTRSASPKNFILREGLSRGPFTMQKKENPKILTSNQEHIKPSTSRSFKEMLLKTMSKVNKLGATSSASPHKSFEKEESPHFFIPESNSNEIGSGCTAVGKSAEQEDNRGSVVPSRFPGFSPVPQALAVGGSDSGTVESINRLLSSSFKVANRVLAMTPWGNYVVFRHRPNAQSKSAATWFYVFDGCTCDIDRFRHLDLTQGTDGLLAFRKQAEVVCHIIDSREKKTLEMLDSLDYDPPHERLKKHMAR
ncbi:hypothetical protein KR074_002645, partial [Drosophila pseudoananassae]